MLKKSNDIYRHGLQLLIPSCSSPLISRLHSVQHLLHRYRLYATAHGFPEQDLSWPSSSSFTPYDVFKQDKKAPYSKSRFYELVKIYHPDRPCHDHPLCKDIPPEVRLQRYRLVVTAHEILSDPARRAAYDFSGEGWGLHPRRSEGPAPSWARSGSSDYGPIHTNATWEDWERWRNRHQGKQQHMVDNRTFTIFIILLTLFGGAMQASWITRVSTGYESRLQELNSESTRFLTGRRENTVNQMASNEAKVQHFLIRRDPSGYGLKGEEQPVYQTLLNPRTSDSEAEVEAITAKGQGKPNRKQQDDKSKIGSLSPAHEPTREKEAAHTQ
ncbi:J domain-containing protein [Aspergillus affinis]|uniref:J domain-containing protein n=1 Tax=Aspergillus affinis TaxID=1070780 RepID=UPI0022FE7D33|nr:putative Hsp40 co-chaperone Jid1 [Aspergillus affinis]KAI9041263.1 putative Hsp40 co-chaperone Jid1 [Aspergillus affinis]